jgi:hypothetical protein
MNKRLDRALRGPSWTEVILGALLSLILGVIVGALLLMFRPVVVAKDTPKDIDPKRVYFVEGPRDGGKSASALAKRKAFLEGQNVTVTDNELNALAAAGDKASPGAAPKAPEKKKADAKPGEKPTAGSIDDMLALGTANFRIHDGAMQVGVPVTLSLFGLSEKVIVQARGGFVKQGDIFVYQPDAMYFGSCPVQRLPFLAGYARNKLFAAAPIPDDLKAAWTKLSNVAIEGNALKLSVP